MSLESAFCLSSISPATRYKDYLPCGPHQHRSVLGTWIYNICAPHPIHRHYADADANSADADAKSLRPHISDFCASATSALAVSHIAYPIMCKFAALMHNIFNHRCSSYISSTSLCTGDSKGRRLRLSSSHSSHLSHVCLSFSLSPLSSSITPSLLWSTLKTTCPTNHSHGGVDCWYTLLTRHDFADCFLGFLKGYRTINFFNRRLIAIKIINAINRHD